MARQIVRRVLGFTYDWNCDERVLYRSIGTQRQGIAEVECEEVESTIKIDLKKEITNEQH